ncbi:hypothetical protein [Vibrio hepatarius]|uniref:hypothetical protein n=1 Tax=Vibrio hepatarius TaxID=171383 RepID=UPI001C083C6A|nr:hypothetical protein [Vibrio hepatarius]MBU2898082.1 hypothetical protein [Vibrio hepatarius]
MNRKSRFVLWTLIALSPLAVANTVHTCQDLVGQWQSPDSSHSYTMNILPTNKVCGDSCVEFDVSYTLDAQQTNRLVCYEGQAGVPDKVPMVLSFEGKYGGHSIGSYNRDLGLMWTGVLAKDSNKQWQPNMQSYWFYKTK